jgi:hypothetical protein
MPRQVVAVLGRGGDIGVENLVEQQNAHETVESGLKARATGREQEIIKTTRPGPKFAATGFRTAWMPAQRARTTGEMAGMIPVVVGDSLRKGKPAASAVVA